MTGIVGENNETGAQTSRYGPVVGVGSGHAQITVSPLSEPAVGSKIVTLETAGPPELSSNQTSLIISSPFLVRFNLIGDVALRVSESLLARCVVLSRYVTSPNLHS